MTTESNVDQKVQKWLRENTKDTDLASMLSDLETNELVLFDAEYEQVKKSKTVGMLLALFLGGIGAHQFYLGKILWGVIYLALCWTFVPILLSIIEVIFFISGRVDQHNTLKARAIVAKIKLMRPGTPSDIETLTSDYDFEA